MLASTNQGQVKRKFARSSRRDVCVLCPENLDLQERSVATVSAVAEAFCVIAVRQTDQINQPLHRIEFATISQGLLMGILFQLS